MFCLGLLNFGTFSRTKLGTLNNSLILDYRDIRLGLQSTIDLPILNRNLSAPYWKIHNPGHYKRQQEGFINNMAWQFSASLNDIQGQNRRNMG